MKRFFFHLLALSCLLCLSGACSTPPEEQPASTPGKVLRVLTYNIHHGEGLDGAFDYDRLATAIAAARPDLVALQEVDRGTRRSGGADQAALLAGKLAMHHAFGEAMSFEGGSYGEAVLSRFPLKNVKVRRLSCSSGQEPRALLMVMVEPFGDSGPRVVFAGTHLDHQSRATRMRQVWEIQKALSNKRGPIVMAGDFNCLPGTPPYLLLSEGWIDAARAAGCEAATFGTNPDREGKEGRIDYVWLRRGRGSAAVSARVIEEPLASDHLPLLTVIELASPAAGKAPPAGGP